MTKEEAINELTQMYSLSKNASVHNEAISMAIKALSTDAIDELWIVKQIQNTSGAESSYYSRMLHKWREEHESV